MEGRVVQKRPQPALPAECLLVSKSSVRMRNLPLTRDQRAFGFDRRVIQLNFPLLRRDDWPTPHLVSRVVHSVAHPLKEAVQAVFVGAKSLVRHLKRSRIGVEADTSEEKSAEEIAMDKYRRKLEHTFGSSERVDYLMEVVRDWTYGE